MTSTTIVSAPRLGDVLQNEYGTQVGYAREKAVANDTAGVVYNIGAIMGKNGSKVRLFQAGDTFAGIFIGTADNKDYAVANGTDKNVVLLTRGPAAVGSPLRAPVGHRTQHQYVRHPATRRPGGRGTLARMDRPAPRGHPGVPRSHAGRSPHAPTPTAGEAHCRHPR